MFKSIFKGIKSKLQGGKSKAKRRNPRQSEIQRLRGGILLEQRKNMLNESMLNSNKRGVTEHKYFDDHQIIVSLTTFGVRISQVYLAIESIMQQTKQANRIVLWLPKEFEGTILPQPLINQMARGLEICYCDDIRSFTKLVPALRMFPNDAIITIDDDVIYNIYTLESLINSYLEDQSYIYFNRGHRVSFDGDKLKRYKRWDWMIGDRDISVLNFPTGMAGVLYPPHILHPEVLNEDVFMSECKYADDIWFYAMTIHNNRRSRKSKSLMLDAGGGVMNNSVAEVNNLHSINIRKGMNDIQLKAVLSRYGLLDKIKSEANIGCPIAK